NKLPERAETARVYKSYITNHILPRWGAEPLSAVQPRSVELWLEELTLAPKTKGHIRGVLRVLMEHAQWAGMVPLGRNPLSLVKVKGCSKPRKRARVLS